MTATIIVLGPLIIFCHPPFEATQLMTTIALHNPLMTAQLATDSLVYEEAVTFIRTELRGFHAWTKSCNLSMMMEKYVVHQH